MALALPQRLGPWLRSAVWRRDILFWGVTFLSAFLLFVVQPILGKRLLPMFGGGAAVWTTCLLFFQALLVVGYLYCHLTTKYLTPKAQAVVHGALLWVSAVGLDIVPQMGVVPNLKAPLVGILQVLLRTVGLPYFTLATTGPLLQVWLARERQGKAPYGLYALSNGGALLALLGYPAWVEPTWGAATQAKGFAFGYWVFAVLCGVLAFRAAKFRQSESAASRGPLGFANKTMWLVLSACPSILLLAMTRALSLDIAPMPLVWVLPLAAYLLSFVVCFGFPHLCDRRVWGGLFVFALVLLVLFPPQDPRPMALWVKVTHYVLTLFVFSVCAHGELFRLRPQGEDLTGFYFVLALGGALGASLVAVIAPAIFVLDFEVPIGVTLLALALFAVYTRDSKAFAGPHGRLRVPFAMVIVAALVALLSQDQIRQFQTSAFLGRSFYGSLRATDRGVGEEKMRSLSHGRTVHGEQFLAPSKRRLRTAYYGELSGASIALYLSKPEGSRRVGVIGLGVGTLLSYGRKGDIYRVYEIDELVVLFAKNHFYYWADAEADVSLVLGDARIALAAEVDNGFDVLLVDAFSGDAIPTHLLTKEAFALYKRHLAPNGILAVHTSNRYLDLASVAALSASAIGMEAVRVHNDEDPEQGVFSATWVLVFQQRDAAAEATDAQKGDVLRLQEMILRHGEAISPPKSLRVWTDDHNSLLPILE